MFTNVPENASMTCLAIPTLLANQLRLHHRLLTIGCHIMKVLYIIKRDMDAAALGMLARHREQADISVVDPGVGRYYDSIIRISIGRQQGDWLVAPGK